MVEQFIALWNSLLNTEGEGISEESYECLVNLGDTVCPEFMVLAEQNVIKTMDERFYISTSTENI